MEAWLKFRPENVTLPIGLSIGRLVFGALNKMEWAFAFVISSHIFISKNKISFLYLTSFTLPLLLLSIQTFLILPVLNQRVDLLVSGAIAPPSAFHFYYIGIELIKVICLFIFGIATFKLYEDKVGKEIFS